MGGDHGLYVGYAAARSASVGLLHPHGQTQTLRTRTLMLSPEVSSQRLNQLYLYFSQNLKFVNFFMFVWKL